jgi:hypothetical protein
MIFDSNGLLLFYPEFLIGAKGRVSFSVPKGLCDHRFLPLAYEWAPRGWLTKQRGKEERQSWLGAFMLDVEVKVWPGSFPIRFIL